MTTPRRYPSRLTPVCLAAATVALASCGGERPGQQAAQAPAPRAIILQPASGDTVGPEVRVVLGAEGVEVVAADGRRVEALGHHHLFIDTDVTSTGAAIPAGVAGIVHIGTGAGESTVSGLAPGEHRIIAVLAYGNHLPMVGVGTDTVLVLVK
jgi:hypothetical protein